MSKALDAIFDALPPRLTIEQLTDILGLSDKQVTYRWLREGRLPAIKLAGSWLILRDDIKEHLNNRYNIQPGSPAETADNASADSPTTAAPDER